MAATIPSVGPAIAITRAALENDAAALRRAAQLLDANVARQSASALLASLEADTAWASNWDDVFGLNDYVGRDGRLGRYPRSALDPVAVLALALIRLYVRDLWVQRNAGGPGLIAPRPIPFVRTRTEIAAIGLMCANIACYAADFGDGDLSAADLLDSAAETARRQYVADVSG